jgi:exopolyphosphatase/guanosine-5'-triphosphate,3'-diphosphate pyrophosphatase
MLVERAVGRGLLTESEGRDFPDRRDGSPPTADAGAGEERLPPFHELLPEKKEDIRLMGTSGTVTTLASVTSRFRAMIAGRRRADGAVGIDAADQPHDVRACRRTSARTSLHRRDRADLVVAGCAILSDHGHLAPRHSELPTAASGGHPPFADGTRRPQD